MAWKGRDKPDVDFAGIIQLLNSSKLQDQNMSLYQTIKFLIDKTQQNKDQTNSTLRSFFGDIIITDDADLSAILTAISNINNIIKFATFITESDETLILQASRQLIAGLNITLDVSVDGRITINASGAAGINEDFLTWSNEAAVLPNSRQLIAGTNITFDDTVANERTINASGSGSGSAQLHGLQRFLGDGATTTFNLLDFAEYLEHVGVNGLFRDPTLFSLSANRDQIVFAAAPGAGEVVTLEYVTAIL